MYDAMSIVVHSGAELAVEVARIRAQDPGALSRIADLAPANIGSKPSRLRIRMAWQRSQGDKGRC